MNYCGCLGSNVKNFVICKLKKWGKKEKVIEIFVIIRGEKINFYSLEYYKKGVFSNDSYYSKVKLRILLELVNGVIIFVIIRIMRLKCLYKR